MKTQVSISPLMFKKDNPKNIGSCISAAGAAATDCLALSNFIKTKHEAGCENTSSESTTNGVLKSAGTLTSLLSSESKPEAAFFGEHLREAVRTVKSFFKK